MNRHAFGSHDTDLRAQAKAAKLDQDKIDEIIAFLAKHPKSGVLMRATGGARKVRSGGTRGGKSGGYCTIHDIGGDDVPLFLLGLIDKSGKQENLTAAQKKALAETLPRIADAYRAAAAQGRRHRYERALMSDFGKELLQSAHEALAIARGKAEPARVFVPPPVDVEAIRKRTGLSQVSFAKRYGFSPGSVRDGEQRRRVPEAAARTLLLVLDREPQAVDRALRP